MDKNAVGETGPLGETSPHPIPVDRGPVIATYTVKVTVRGAFDAARASMTPDDEGFYTAPQEVETPTNEAIEEAVSLALMRYIPEGATATVSSERSDR